MSGSLARSLRRAVARRSPAYYGLRADREKRDAVAALLFCRPERLPRPKPLRPRRCWVSRRGATGPTSRKSPIERSPAIKNAGQRSEPAVDSAAAAAETVLAARAWMSAVLLRSGHTA